MLFYSAYTAHKVKSELHVRHCEEERRSNLIHINRLLLRQLADRNDVPIIILNNPKTKYLPCRIPANALPWRQVENQQSLLYLYKSFTKTKEILL